MNMFAGRSVLGVTALVVAASAFAQAQVHALGGDELPPGPRRGLAGGDAGDGVAHGRASRRGR